MSEAVKPSGTPSSARLSILGKATKADIRLRPYPHLVIEDALPAEVFAELAANFPRFEWIAGAEANDNNKACLKAAADVLGNPAIAPIWQEFFTYHLSRAFFQQVVEIWGETIERTHPGVAANFGKPLADFVVGTRAAGKATSEANKETDIVLDCVFGVNTPVRRVTPVRGPHIDNPVKLFSSLLYFRTADDDSQGGEHQMFHLRNRMYPQRRLKKIPERYVEADIRIPYRANSLLFWLNSALSIHGVTPRGVTPVPRRYVSVTGECYGGEKTGGYFGHHPEWETVSGRLRSLVNL